MTGLAILAENLGKQYRVDGADRGFRYKSLRESLTNRVQVSIRRVASLLRGEASSAAGPDGTIWALRDVSFEVKQGEVVGIIGRNGAGKTTLLRVLSRITEPTEGYAEVHGRVGSLLEVGTGFHPELTGRDNIYLSGAVLGMRRVEIERKFDEIVSFSETGRFIDTPVKHYSSGMYLRLAFSVAAHLEPEILLVDEVLAVGDIQFRRKCLGKMQSVGQSGRTVLFVSHDMGHIRQLCERAIWLDHGSIRESGPADEVCLEYETQATESRLLQNPVVREEHYRTTYPGPKIGQVELRDARSGKLRSDFAFGDSFDLVVRLSDQSEPTDKEYSALWFMHSERGQQLAVGLSFPMDRVVFTSKDRVLICRVGPLSLPTGVYSLRLILFVPHYDKFDDWPDAISFTVAQCDPFATGYEYPGVYTASVYIPHKWRSNRVPRGSGKVRRDSDTLLSIGCSDPGASQEVSG